MKLRLQFGIAEPKRDIVWWQTIQDFPTLVMYKETKWEFNMFQADDTNQVDYLCYFSEVQTYDPNWYATTYTNIDHLINGGYGVKCECGAAWTSFPNQHMFFCKKWSKW